MLFNDNNNNNRTRSNGNCVLYRKQLVVTSGGGLGVFVLDIPPCFDTPRFALLLATIGHS